MPRSRTLRVALLSALLIGAAIAGNPGEEGVSGDASLRAYRDPITGRIGPPPPTERLTGARRSLTETVIEPLPGGGFRMIQRGKHRAVGTLGPQGVVVECRDPVGTAERE